MYTNNRPKSNIINQVQDALERVSSRIHYYKNKYYNDPITFQYLRIEDELLDYLDELLNVEKVVCCGSRMTEYSSNEWVSFDGKDWDKVLITRVVCISCGAHWPK